MIQRKSFGRMTDVSKRMKVKIGEDCKCKRFKFFETVTEEERNAVIGKFNELPSYYEQSLDLAGLIYVLPVSRRRNRKDESEAKFHEAAYFYR